MEVCVADIQRIILAVCVTLLHTMKKAKLRSLVEMNKFCLWKCRHQDLSALSIPVCSVFALLPVHLTTLLTGKFTWIWEFLSLPTTSDLWKIRLKVSWCGKPLSYAARQITTLTEPWSGSPKAGRLVSTPCPGYPQQARPCWHIESCPPDTIRPPWQVVSLLFLQMQSKYQGTTRKDGTRPALFPRNADKLHRL
jgi:hypothetical protein